MVSVSERGESALREIFQATVPAGAGEFVSTLSSEVYWKDLPALRRLPDLIEIVIVLLGDHVKREIIGSALGCSASYLKGLDPKFFSAVCTSATKLHQPKLLWKEATGATPQENQEAVGETGREDQEAVGETGQEDQTKKGM
ncbi:uncharacterized protein K444DRAFT_103171 [Hyaloscypha bicolor E]|uniref:Uncharacterized protein n=1 Tax=Hyaloscypha bicolor E TaxID=1095630 RepID=A0A2J6SX20_9HELO|nr:uncharacterized protein K444DRAFT_103171 [Hyaloscypha bicolor E]PMD55326.1 hypothetical protein K444DRAFT_103171 [Hyaloscypha bicolor E]